MALRCWVVIAWILCASVAGAQEAQQIIDTRIAGFRDMGAAFKTIGDQLKAHQPDRLKIQASVAAIDNYRVAIPNWFPPGSEPPPRPPQSWLDWICHWFGCGRPRGPKLLESHAKAAVWTQPERFKQAWRRFDAAAVDLSRASRGGDVNAMTAPFKKLESSCKGCHEVFREEVD